MATVTTAFAMTSDLFTFQHPGGHYVGPKPFGQLTFGRGEADTVPALGAGDVNVTTWTGTLPRNFVYRMVECRFGLATTAEAQLDNAAIGMRALFTENQVTTKTFPLFNTQALNAGGAVAFPGINPAITNDHVAWAQPWPPEGLYNDIIDASQGISNMQVTWIDDAPTTTAFTVTPWVRFLSYTVEQYNAAQVFDYVPVAT